MPSLESDKLTHWGRVTHICVSKLTIIGSDNGLWPDRRQAIIWTNAGLLLIGPLRINVSEILIKILTFSFKKMRLKVSSANRRPFCLGLNVLKKARGMKYLLCLAGIIAWNITQRDCGVIKCIQINHLLVMLMTTFKPDLCFAGIKPPANQKPALKILDMWVNVYHLSGRNLWLGS